MMYRLQRCHHRAAELMSASTVIAAACPGDTDTASSEPECPRCAGPVYRVPRRLFDLFINLFTPVHRYRCHWTYCGWEGRLHTKPPHQ